MKREKEISGRERDRDRQTERQTSEDRERERDTHTKKTLGTNCQTTANTRLPCNHYPEGLPQSLLQTQKEEGEKDTVNQTETVRMICLYLETDTENDLHTSSDRDTEKQKQ